jgi:hypothetical protein
MKRIKHVFLLPHYYIMVKFKRRDVIVLYLYQSPIGLMLIKLNPNTIKYSLIINSICYEEHDSAASAADNVYMHVTGCNEWDILDGKVSAPHDISEWKTV